MTEIAIVRILSGLLNPLRIAQNVPRFVLGFIRLESHRIFSRWRWQDGQAVRCGLAIQKTCCAFGHRPGCMQHGHKRS